MATPSVGQRDKQGRYWTGTGWKSLEQVMKSQQTSPGRTGERIILPGVGEIQYTGSKYGWQTRSTVKSRQSAQPDPEPVKPKDGRLDSPVAGTGPKGNEVGSRVRAVPVIPAPAATSTATTTPAPAATTQRPTQTQRPPESKVSPSKPAQTGDRTKDLTTWALANKSMIDKVGTKAQREILTKAQTGGTMPAPRPLKASYEYDAYDLVLEYLLSQGHTDTVEEAHYVMMEMDAETIGTIVEAAADQSDNQIDKGVKTTYKAQNVLDNQHQGRSKGLNRLPRGEREEKAKRMRGRLKSRRDDLFGERNKREDSKREQLKKMLGL